MSTITREFTKEQLIEHIKGRKEFADECAADSTLHPERREYYELTAEAMRIALASLEAARGMIRRFDLDMSDCDSCGQDCGADMVEDLDGEYVLWDEVLPHLYRYDEYTAPPAPENSDPVAWLWSHRKHPSEVALVRPEDDERAEGAHWSGWSCQALYAEPPAPVSMKDHQIRELVNELRDIAVEYHGTQQLRERIARTVRAAMLQGAEKAESTTTMQAAPELDSSPKNAESTSGNSPVIPDGWVIVPIEPTEDMIVNGFESEPDESFSDEKEWEVYDAMSGCQQAAHRAKLCWAAMIKAAPKLE